ASIRVSLERILLFAFPGSGVLADNSLSKASGQRFRLHTCRIVNSRMDHLPATVTLANPSRADNLAPGEHLLNVVTPGLQKVWIAGVHGDSDYLLDITCLCACIKLAGFVVVRTK